MLPADWGEVSEVGVWNVLDLAEGVDRTGEIARVPENDGGDDQIEAGCPVLLVFEGSVPDFTEPVKKFR